MRHLMNHRLIIVLTAIIAFAIGLFAGKRSSIAGKPQLELYFSYPSSQGIVTAYTFYTTASGEKIKHGWFHEVSADMKVNVHVRYENGLIKEGGGRID